MSWLPVIKQEFDRAFYESAPGAALSPVVADGANNHSSSGFIFFVRGDGSVGNAKGNGSMKWYENKAIKDFCKSPNDLPDYSF